ncbi:MAG: hypothetical protein ABUL69_00485, partial [Peristeroidobacter soli]
TKPGNLALLCQFHHRAVHEGGILIELLDAGALRFVKPNGKSVDNVAPGYTQPRGDVRKLPAGKVSTKWHGEHMSLDLAVAVMLQPRWDVPAGTSNTA